MSQFQEMTNVDVIERRGPSTSVIFLIAALAVFTIFITGRARKLETRLLQPTNVQTQAPNFWAAAPDGHTVSLSDFRGKQKLVVVFWASWCQPCHIEMASLNHFYHQHHAASSDFEILAVSEDTDTAAATRYAAMHKLSFPIVFDPSERVADSFEYKGLPTVFVVNKAGTITYARVGFNGDISSLKQADLARELGIDPNENLHAEGGSDGIASH